MLQPLYSLDYISFLLFESFKKKGFKSCFAAGVGTTSQDFFIIYQTIFVKIKKEKEKIIIIFVEVMVNY